MQIIYEETTLRLFSALLLFSLSITAGAADISFRAVWAAADTSQTDDIEIIWLKGGIPAGSAVLANTAVQHEQMISNVNNGDSIGYRVTFRNAFGETSTDSGLTSAVAGTPPPAPTGLQDPAQLP